VLDDVEEHNKTSRLRKTMDAQHDDQQDGNQQAEEEARPMNDSTLPRKKTVVAAGPPLTGPRQKQPPPDGGTRRRFGLADWHRLLQSSPNLAGNKNGIIRKMGWDEIRQHKTVHDGWIVLRGKVYNVSPYLAYHPGGAAVLERVLGKDVTVLFDKYHRWVNESGYVLGLLYSYELRRKAF
jgi:Cytochrome b5-like Heme/Steroid binding domain